MKLREGYYDEYEDEVDYDYEEPESEDFSTYRNHPICWVKFTKVHFNEDEDDEATKEEYDNYVANHDNEDYDGPEITEKIKILSVETSESYYNSINEYYDDEWDLDASSNFEGEVCSDIANIDDYVGKCDGYTCDENGIYTIDYTPSLDMDDIDSVNRYLEHEYGIDNYNPLYILTDGVGLDSQTQYGIRGRDHHLTNEEGSYTLSYLLANGAIRCMPESPGISISCEPNNLQRGPLLRWLNNFRGQTFYLDICDKEGDQTVCSAVFNNMNPQAVIGQLNNYFRDGIKPRGSMYENKKKKVVVRLTENDLHGIVKEAIQNIINEGRGYDTEGLMNSYAEHFEDVKNSCENDSVFFNALFSLLGDNLWSALNRIEENFSEDVFENRLKEDLMKHIGEGDVDDHLGDIIDIDVEGEIGKYAITVELEEGNPVDVYVRYESKEITSANGVLYLNDNENAQIVQILQ